jgi:calcineurin-like phosphoesterase family protein
MNDLYLIESENHLLHGYISHLYNNNLENDEYDKIIIEKFLNILKKVKKKNYL